MRFEKLGVRLLRRAGPFFLQLILYAGDGISDTTDVLLRRWVICPQKCRGWRSQRFAARLEFEEQKRGECGSHSRNLDGKLKYKSPWNGIGTSGTADCVEKNGKECNFGTLGTNWENSG